LGSLIVVPSKETRLELWLSLDEIRCLAIADWRCAAVCEQSIGHFFQPNESRRVESRIQIKDVLDDRLLLEGGEVS
jgi:hypothetical protein